MKKQRGITLIALIITIIVMLILVGVTVSVALNGGLFEQAKKATQLYTVEAEREQIQMAYANYIMQKNSSQKTADFETLEAYFLNSDMNELVASEEEDKFILTNGIEILKDNLFDDSAYFFYAIFTYNNNSYKIAVNYNTVIGLEQLPKIEIADTEVSEILNGWSIKFNASGNEYVLLENGNLTAKGTLYQEILENPDDYIYGKVIGYEANGWDKWMIYDVSSDGYVRIVPIVGSGDVYTTTYKYDSNISNKENLDAVLTICNKFVNPTFANSATLITTEEFAACYSSDNHKMDFKGFAIDNSKNILVTQTCNYNPDENPDGEYEYPVIPVVKLSSDIKVKDGGNKDVGYEIYK